ncbi:MAG: hypothetical protein EPO27_14825 [Betaproteobacteria bacterium]|nr:MAG: hypothetical protein EPO27_14825 [Betaproteobacteria bacterium]
METGSTCRFQTGPSGNEIQVLLLAPGFQRTPLLKEHHAAQREIKGSAAVMHVQLRSISCSSAMASGRVKSRTYTRVALNEYQETRMFDAAAPEIVTRALRARVANRIGTQVTGTYDPANLSRSGREFILPLGV